MESPVWFQYTLNFFFIFNRYENFKTFSIHLEIFNMVLFNTPWNFQHSFPYTLKFSTHLEIFDTFSTCLEIFNTSSTHLETRFSIFSTLYVLWMLWIRIPTGVTEILVLKLKLNWYRSVRYSLNDWMKQFWFCNNYKT